MSTEWQAGYDDGYKDGYNAGLAARKPTTENGTEAKQCLDYYFQTYKNKLGCVPTIYGARDMKILKGLLKNYDLEAVKETMDTFFAYDKRVDYTLPRFQSRFDVLYLRNKRIAEGR